MPRSEYHPGAVDSKKSQAVELRPLPPVGRVIRDISLLIVPSAESLAIRGDKHLRCLIESVNEGWNNSIPLTATRPQPDYAVGFRREAFTEEQLGKLQPFVGELTQRIQLHTHTV